jgi:hypothetical protein
MHPRFEHSTQTVVISRLHIQRWIGIDSRMINFLSVLLLPSTSPLATSNGVCIVFLLVNQLLLISPGGLAVSRLLEVEWQPEALESLELSERQKTLIHSLVREHSSTSFDDVIKGKRRGLIGLLSGSPGSGKPLTAEAVAEVCKKPFYLVSAGELGTKPDEVDKRLKFILELSHKWDAVLLLDDADVFLQKRTTKM